MEEDCMQRVIVSFAVLIMLWSGVAQATAIFTLGNNPQPDEENILLGGDETGTTVTGTTNQSNTTVNFSSTTDTLTEPSAGQARIEALDGLINNIAVTVPNNTFADLIVNPLCPPGSGGCGDATVTVVTNDGTFPFTYSLGNGQNFLTITTINNEIISSVTIDNTTGFADLRQPRISGIGGSPVPEPSSIILFGSGFVGLALWSWKKWQARP